MSIPFLIDFLENQLTQLNSLFIFIKRSLSSQIQLIILTFKNPRLRFSIAIDWKPRKPSLNVPLFFSNPTNPDKTSSQFFKPTNLA